MVTDFKLVVQLEATKSNKVSVQGTGNKSMLEERRARSSAQGSNMLLRQEGVPSFTALK